MKVLFDLLYIRDNSPSGIKKYAFKLIHDFAIYKPEISISILAWKSQSEYLKGMWVTGSCDGYKRLG